MLFLNVSITRKTSNHTHIMWASKTQQKNDIFTTEHKIISQSSLAYFIVPNYSYLILKEVKIETWG